MNNTPSITIIGGGVIGLCCAYYLQKQDYKVTIIDKGDITKGTSFGNAGYISPSHFVPLASPGIVAKGLRWMLSSTSPFYIKPRLNWELLQWCYTFWRKANTETVKKNAPPLNNILKLSRELSSDIKNDLGNKFRMEEKGCLMLYKNANTEKHEMELANEAAKFDLETKTLDAKQVQELEPELEVNVRGGILYPADAHLHPGEFMVALKNHLIANGVNIQIQTAVTGFERNGGKISGVLTDQGKFNCDELVLAAGSWLTVITKSLGIKILMQAGKGYSMTFENMKRNLHYPAILVDNRVAMTPMGNALRMGGTMEISGLDSPVMVKRAKAIFHAAKQYYPGLQLEFPSVEKIWSGLRPLTPDGLPYIGRHRSYSNLTIAGGHAMLGLSLAAATGKLVEEIIGEKKKSVDIYPFSPERFL